MKKILILSLFVLLSGVFAMFGYSAFLYYQALHQDDPINPYVMVEKGNLSLIRGDDAYDLISGEKIPLKEKDILITKAASLAIVHWPDHSETRLDAFSRMTIDHMRVEKGYRTIEIEAKLENGKAWTQVVHTIYPDSYFRFTLPQGGIIAGVRGTVFDINLDKKYIHSVDHSVALSDKKGRNVLLLPGELVSTEDILTRLSATLIDNAWVAYNTLKDQTENDIRTLRNTKYMKLLEGQSSGIRALWEKIASSMLSWFPGFGGISLYQSLQNKDTVPNIPTEKLLEMYQRFQDTKFVQERDRIREIIAKNGLDDMMNPTRYLEHFAQSSLWDELTFTGMTLSGSEALFRSYRETLTTQMQNVLEVIPLRDLEKKARETMRQFLE